MIKTKKGKTKIVGTEREVFCDLAVAAATVFDAFKSNHTVARSAELVQHAVELALMTDEERDKRLQRIALRERDENNGEGDADAD